MNVRKIGGQIIEDDGSYFHLHIKKPIYGHCVAISEEILRVAERSLRGLVVSCPGASEMTTPLDWKHKSQRISKVFRFPNNPMILWQGTIGQVPRPEVEQPKLV